VTTTTDIDAITQPIELPTDGRSGRRAPRGTLLIAVVLGVGISVGLGVYGKFHKASAVAISLAGFSSGLSVKAWLASLAFAFVLVQLITALRMYGKLGSAATGQVASFLHRWSGRLAVLVSVPVAVHCLYALGFQDYSVRVLAHSLLGCFFYGAFAAKMLVLSRDGAPKWALPVLGGVVFTALTAIWLTSSLWFFGTSGVKF
jgi:Family of unknown function (DUF6529)